MKAEPIVVECPACGENINMTLTLGKPLRGSQPNTVTLPIKVGYQAISEHAASCTGRKLESAPGHRNGCQGCEHDEAAFPPCWTDEQVRASHAQYAAIIRGDVPPAAAGG